MLLSTREVAARLGVDESTVRRAASKHGLGQKKGWSWAFTARDLARLRKVIHDGPGNPNWRKKGK